MTEAIHRDDRLLGGEAALADPALARLLFEMELQGLLEEVANRAAEWFGATRVVVDRTGGPDSCDVRLVIGDEVFADLWALDPLLWDDANWAGVRFVPAGQVLVVRPTRG